MEAHAFAAMRNATMRWEEGKMEIEVFDIFEAPNVVRGTTCIGYYHQD
jgi:hypothetical protein